MNNLRANLALLLAAVALCLSIWTSSQAFNNAGLALQQREQQLVAHYAPKVTKFCEDFNMTAPKHPNTIEELLAPLTALYAPLGTTPQ